MKQTFASLALASVLLGLAACQDSGSSPSSTPAALTDAFATVPLGFGDVESTFPSSTDSGDILWRPGGHRNGGFHDRGGMMCGGASGFFNLGLGFGLGRGFYRGELPGTCAFNAVSGRVECDTVVRHGLSIVRSAAYSDASGTVQEHFDSLTNTVNVTVDVSGSYQRRDGDSTTVDHHSDRTVTGLAPGSGSRTVSGASGGTETTTGTDSTGSFTAVRTLGDTIQDVVLPAPGSSGPHYPTAGSIIRAMEASVTYSGGSPVTSSRREVITFDGSEIATVVITRDGVTKNCTLNLTRGGRLSCSN